MLPPGTARADVAADGGDTEARFRKAPLVPLEARSFGEDGRFVAQPAPADPGWQDQDAAVVDLQ